MLSRLAATSRLWVSGICPTLGGTATVKYAFTDHQGSTRALMDGSGNVIARHDYLPFGEELWAGVGMRTAAQKFGAMDQTRMRYGLTEKDEATGLDHTWFRKHENNSGRWTSPDPLSGSVGDPQSFNRYSYSLNDPVNLIDPSGLKPGDQCFTGNGQPGIEGNDGRCYETPRGHVDVDPPTDTSPMDDPTMYNFVLNSFFGGFVGGRLVTICTPVQFKVTGIAPGQAPGKTAISQQERADIPDGGVAIKPGNFGAKGINQKNRSVFLNMRFIVDWSTAKPAGAPRGIPTDGPFDPVDNIGPASVRNSPGNMIDVYNYTSKEDALASTRTVTVTTIIPANSEGVTCPKGN